MDEKGISKSFFKSAKHIEKGSALEYAVLKIIGIDKFPQNEVSGFIVFHVKIQHV